MWNTGSHRRVVLRVRVCVCACVWVCVYVVSWICLKYWVCVTFRPGLIVRGDLLERTPPSAVLSCLRQRVGSLVGLRMYLEWRGFCM